MPINNLRNKVAASDIEKIRNRKAGSPEYEEGFEPEEDVDFSELFDDINDTDDKNKENTTSTDNNTVNKPDPLEKLKAIKNRSQHDINDTPSKIPPPTGPLSGISPPGGAVPPGEVRPFSNRSPFSSDPPVRGRPEGNIPPLGSLRPLGGIRPPGGFNHPGSPGTFNRSGSSFMGGRTYERPGGFSSGRQQTGGQEDYFDRFFDSLTKGLLILGKLALEVIKSSKYRTVDDLGVYSKNIITTSLIISAGAVLIGIIGTFSGIKALSFFGIPFKLLTASVLAVGTGLIGLGTAALLNISKNDPANTTVEEIDDVLDAEGRNVREYEGKLNGVLKEKISDVINKEDLNEKISGVDLKDKSEEDEEIEDFEDEEDDFIESFGKEFEKEFGEEFGEEFDEKVDEFKKDIDYESYIEKIPEKVPMLSREFLFDTFKPLFKRSNPEFSKKRIIDPDTDEFTTIETLALKALAAAAKSDLDKLDSSLESAVETFFSYELRVKRVRGLTKLEDIEREMTAYFRDSSEDESVSTKVDIDGDFYKVTINKGVKSIVTFGDIFTLDYVVDFFKDTNNALPVAAGITESGKPILVDLKRKHNMMIAGKPQSGKSWYILSLLTSLMAFNTPEDVVFLLIDPKESTLFKTLSLMPHVCGLHNDDNILKILEDVIELEGGRRKKLLADHNCEDIWDLREQKNIKLPILYIVIDEIMTINSRLGPDAKTFSKLMATIISQMPSLGVRLIFVPHRPQGTIDKTVRLLLEYVVAVRAEPTVVKETLDIKTWNRALTHAGDMALKIQDFGKEMVARGVAVTTSRHDNTIFLKNLARGYYKMGVEIPNMKTIGMGYNRDEEKIKHELELKEEISKVQFNT